MNFKKCMYFVEGSCEEQLINALERHHIDVSRLWVTKPVGNFTFVEQNGDEIKI